MSEEMSNCTCRPGSFDPACLVHSIHARLRHTRQQTKPEDLDFGLRPVAENFAHLWNALRASAEALADAHSVLSQVKLSFDTDSAAYDPIPFEHQAISCCACSTAKAYMAAREVITKIRMGVDT